MKRWTVDTDALEQAGWAKYPNNTHYEDGHIEGTILDPHGQSYHYEEREQTTIFIPDGQP